MAAQLAIETALTTSLKALQFPVITWNPETCDSTVTGTTEAIHGIQHCPEEIKYRSVNCARNGQVPHVWSWNVVVRTKNIVAWDEVIRQWQAPGLVLEHIPAADTANPQTWRVTLDSVQSHFRPHNNPSHGTKLTLKLTLTHL